MKQILYNRPTTQWLHIFISHIQSPSLQGSLRKSTSWQESNTSQKLNKSRAQQPRWQLPVPSVNLPCLEPARVCPGSHSNPWWWRALPLLSNCFHGRPGCRGCCRPWGCLLAGFAEPPLCNGNKTSLYASSLLFNLRVCKVPSTVVKHSSGIFPNVGNVHVEQGDESTNLSRRLSVLCLKTDTK